MQTAIDARMNFLASALNDMASSRAASLSMRLNFVVFVLTIVSITSTVSAVIALLDLTGELVRCRVARSNTAPRTRTCGRCGWGSRRASLALRARSVRLALDAAPVLTRARARALKVVAWDSVLVFFAHLRGLCSHVDSRVAAAQWPMSSRNLGDDAVQDDDGPMVVGKGD